MVISVYPSQAKELRVLDANDAGPLTSTTHPWQVESQGQITFQWKGWESTQPSTAYNVPIEHLAGHLARTWVEKLVEEI